MTIKERFFYTIGKCVWAIFPAIARLAVRMMRERINEDDAKTPDAD